MTKATGLLDYLDKNPAALPEESVPIPEWGGRAITLRGFTSRERDAFEADNLTRANAKAANGARKRGAPAEADLTNFRARLVARSIVEDGVRTCANERGEELLGSQPASVLDRLFSVAQRLHGMTDADVEEMTKNSGETEDADSSSVSLSPSDAPSLN